MGLWYEKRRWYLRHRGNEVRSQWVPRIQRKSLIFKLLHQQKRKSKKKESRMHLQEMIITSKTEIYPTSAPFGRLKRAVSNEHRKEIWTSSFMADGFLFSRGDLRLKSDTFSRKLPDNFSGQVKRYFFFLGLAWLSNWGTLGTPLVRHMTWRVSEHYTHNSSTLKREVAKIEDVLKIKTRKVGWSRGTLEKQTFQAVLERSRGLKGTAMEKMDQLS